MAHPTYDSDEFDRLAEKATDEQKKEVVSSPRYCTVCGDQIPPERLETFPNTDKCVNHTTTQSYIGVPVFSHKTAPETVLIDPNSSNSKEVLRQADRANRRAR